MRQAFALVVTAALGAAVAFQAMAEDWAARLGAADIVVFGEVHDNPVHHARQADAVAAVQPAALVFEMLTPAQADQVTEANRADPGALAAALAWAESGWPDFALYHPIFTASPARIYGGALERSAVFEAAQRGAAAPLGADAARFGLDQPLPEDEQAAREAFQMAAHCNALPEEMLPGMVAAQRARDGSLARAALEALEDTGGPVIVIAGTGHARDDWGVPGLLRRAAPKLTVISVGQIEEGTEAPGGFSITLSAPPAERDDPCAAFRDTPHGVGAGD